LKRTTTDINNFGGDVRGDWKIYNEFGDLKFMRGSAIGGTSASNLSLCINGGYGNVGINSEFPSCKLEIFDLEYSQAITQSTPNYRSAIKVYKSADSVVGNVDGIVLCNFLEADNSKGIAISNDGLMCSGINTNQEFNICAKGNGSIKLRNNATISGTLMVAGTTTVRQTGYGYVDLSIGSTGNYCGSVGFMNAAGDARGYIGYQSSYSNYLQICNFPTNGCLGYNMTGNLIIDGTLGIGTEAGVPLWVKDGSSLSSTYFKAVYFGYDPAGTYVYDSRLEA